MIEDIVNQLGMYIAESINIWSCHIS